MCLQNTRATWPPLIRALLSGTVHKVALSWVHGVIRGSNCGTDPGTPRHCSHIPFDTNNAFFVGQGRFEYIFKSVS